MFFDVYLMSRHDHLFLQLKLQLILHSFTLDVRFYSSNTSSSHRKKNLHFFRYMIQ